MDFFFLPEAVTFEEGHVVAAGRLLSEPTQGSVRSHCFVLQPAPRSLGKNKIPSLFSSLKKTLTETFPKQQSGPSAQSPRQGSRLFLSLSIFAFFPKKQGWSYGGVGLWHREDGKRNRAAKCRPAESFLLVVSRCVLPTLKTYGNRWVPHMDRDFAPSRRAWRPDDAVSHGWLPCPISSSTFCGALTPGSLRAQNHCMPEPEVLCRTQNRRQWLTTAL